MTLCLLVGVWIGATVATVVLALLFATADGDDDE